MYFHLLKRRAHVAYFSLAQATPFLLISNGISAPLLVTTVLHALQSYITDSRFSSPFESFTIILSYIMTQPQSAKN